MIRDSAQWWVLPALVCVVCLVTVMLVLASADCIDAGLPVLHCIWSSP